MHIDHVDISYVDCLRFENHNERNSETWQASPYWIVSSAQLMNTPKFPTSLSRKPTVPSDYPYIPIISSATPRVSKRSIKVPNSYFRYSTSAITVHPKVTQTMGVFGRSSEKEKAFKKGRIKGHEEGLEEGKRTERESLRGAAGEKLEDMIKEELREKLEPSVKKSIRKEETDRYYLDGRRTGWDDVTSKIVDLKHKLGGTRKPQRHS